MSIRIGVGPSEIDRRTADPQASRLAAVAAEGRFDSFWLPQGLGFDALGVLQSVAAEAPTLEIGVAVVPIQLEHPSSLAARALTVNEATGGRFVLGVGVSHAAPLSLRSLPYHRPADYMEEYLHVLSPLLKDRSVDYQGSRVSAHMTLEIPKSVPAPALIVGALGQRMLTLAGSLADGTTVWMTGPRTVARHVVPTIQKASAAAGRPSPRVIVGMPICVTKDKERAKSVAHELFGFYAQLPPYRASLEREGVASPVDLAQIGDESMVDRVLRQLHESGATDLVARTFGTREECVRTLDVLASR